METRDQINPLTTSAIEDTLKCLNERNPLRKDIYDISEIPEHPDSPILDPLSSEHYNPKDLQLEIKRNSSGLRRCTLQPTKTPMNSTLSKYAINDSNKVKTDFIEFDFSDEVEEESEEERRTRRTTLKKSVMVISTKIRRDLLSSIDIRHLIGNIYLKRSLKRNPQEVFEIHCKPIKMVKCLRRSRGLVKAYMGKFRVTAAILLEILADLIENALGILAAIRVNFAFVRDIMLAWETLHKDIKTEHEFGRGKMEATEKANLARILELKHELLTNQANFLLSARKCEKRLNDQLDRIKNRGIYQDLILKITELENDFLTNFSQIVRWIFEREDIFSNLDPSRNLFIIENKICEHIKIFRERLDKKIINKLYSTKNDIQISTKSHYIFLQEKFIEFEELISISYPKRWNSDFKEILKERLSGDYAILQDKLILFSLLKPVFKRYMKKKLRLSSRAVVNNEDLLDFFEFIDVKYMVESPLLVGYAKCLSMAPEEANGTPKLTLSIICLDVRFINH